MKNDIIMNNMPDSSSMTLESIALRKKELRKKLHVQKEIMTDTARELFAPLAPAADKGNAIMRAFNTGMAVFDGLMLGVKMMRKVRSKKSRVLPLRDAALFIDSIPMITDTFRVTSRHRLPEQS